MALHEAVQRQDLEEVRRRVEPYGEGLFLRDARGRTAPEAAICEGWTEGVRYFIGSPMVGKARLDDLLHFACSRYIPNAEIISLLLQHGANPNSRDHLERTPLHNLILHSSPACK